MQSLLTLTTAAEDRSLLTLDELRQATGVATGSDTKLLTLGRAVAGAIVSHCNVRAIAAAPATLRSEVVSETFRPAAPVDGLILARRPVTAIASVTEDGVALTATDYELDAGAGILYRLSDDFRSWWSASKIVIAYTAGWSTVPDNLRNAAMKLAAVFWSEGVKADPSLKRERIDGVIEREWWVGPSDDPALPREVEDLLADYINPVVG